MAKHNDEEVDRIEAAAIFGCSIRTVFTYEEAGILPKARIINGRQEKRWNKAQIEALAEDFPVEKLREFNRRKKESE